MIGICFEIKPCKSHGATHFSKCKNSPTCETRTSQKEENTLRQMQLFFPPALVRTVLRPQTQTRPKTICRVEGSCNIYHKSGVL